jgi:hypothetical protein
VFYESRLLRHAHIAGRKQNHPGFPSRNLHNTRQVLSFCCMDLTFDGHVQGVEVAGKKRANVMASAG